MELFVSKEYYENPLEGLDPDRDIGHKEEIVIFYFIPTKLRFIGTGIKKIKGIKIKYKKTTLILFIPLMFQIGDCIYDEHVFMW